MLHLSIASFVVTSSYDYYDRIVTIVADFNNEPKQSFDDVWRKPTKKVFEGLELENQILVEIRTDRILVQNVFGQSPGHVERELEVGQQRDRLQALGQVEVQRFRVKDGHGF